VAVPYFMALLQHQHGEIEESYRKYPSRQMALISRTQSVENE
jgi:hypothetical protein